MLKNVVIVSASRTPVGSFQGCFSTVPAPELGATAIKAAIESAKIDPEHIDEVIIGQVLMGGSRQGPGRQAALKAGLNNSIPCTTVNKVCGSGLKTVMLASDNIQVGNSEVIIAGGQESMTLAPHLLTQSRAGYRMGPFQVEDVMLYDGLWCPYYDNHMGTFAELCAKEYGFTREVQDQFAEESYTLAQNAQKKNYFSNEITPVEVKTRKETLSITTDEEPQKANFAKMKTLRPAFEKDGTVTAANASKINDGGAALVIASEQRSQELGLKPLARIRGYASFAQDPKWFTTAPVGAIKKALSETNLKIQDIDLWEINEAFSCVTLAAMKEFNLPRNKVNVNGGAVAIGHPIGASGARILTTLVHALKTHDKQLGLATLCIGGGEAVALIVERI